ncbi:hypothetical protein KAFR_0A03060 [Kazachstania africana CBS 2517]|uniref:Zn(2)-C6 fungal-type domain-containing protein n=1 Tax=Kazachstania africana (strain ATCC 22294 / BCRC 22015 / CBS 2517 / CECT 1963 / NBRC 1671 / NRRL Y-8276) TaxID=1071382 RepID=H2AMZ1_KAZAF|nr:hypothetical protein KAFR_0A03060 [Kazachstania africana CBS 2517]CCF55741.1 hypothetical protein KAFR_0A03060 [Kazachstania africana CBS 2517]
MQEKRQRKQRPSYVCLECRSRKLKCDKARPYCNRCKKDGKVCAYESENASQITIPDDSSNHTLKLSTSFTDISTDGNSNIDSGSTLTFHSHNLGNTVFDLEYFKHKNITIDIRLDLLKPRDTYVTYGSTTYYDMPLSCHSMIQHDPYKRVLCAFLHGSTMADLQYRLNGISNDTVYSNELLGNQLSPLSFIETVIAKWVEKSNNYVTNQLPLDYFNTLYTIEDTMHPNLLSSIKTLLREVELILVDKQQINLLLKNFYENIYPFFPLIDIPSFERKISEILVEIPGNRYEIKVFNSNIRPKLETLVIFLLILSISLRSDSLLTKKSDDTKNNSSETAKQFVIFSQKLLSLLNGFKFTNENILCCMLLIFISEYLDPENGATHSMHNDILTLKCVTELANTLGLFQDPSYFTRFQNNPAFEESFFIFRRRLWISLQSLRLLIITQDAGSTCRDYEQLKCFMLDHRDDYLSKNFMKGFRHASDFDRRLFNVQKNKYEFHINLVRLMNSLAPINNGTSLADVLENIERLNDFMSQKFPYSDLVNGHASEKEYVDMHFRGAKVDINSVEFVENLTVNLIGLSSLMSTYSLLAAHFEMKSAKDWGSYKELYDMFSIECIRKYLQLARIILDYLNGKLASRIKEEFEYSLNKLVIFTMVKIWLIQMGFCMRLSFKSEFRKLQQQNKRLTSNNDEKKVSDLLVTSVMDNLRNQIELLTNSASDKLGSTYFSCQQAVLMLRYLLYMIDNNVLSSTVTGFWNGATVKSQSFDRIIDKIGMKWGITPRYDDIINDYLMNSDVLQSLDMALLEGVEYLFGNAKLNQREATPFSNKNVFSFNDQDMLNALLESNFDLFANIIDDSLGELPNL